MGDTGDRATRLAEAADGQSVTAERLREAVGGTPLYELLSASDQPEHLLRGTVLDVVDRDAPESAADRRSRKVAGSGAPLLTVVTGSRVLMLVPHGEDVDRLSVPLSDVETVDTETAPGKTSRLRIFTPGTVYYPDVSRSTQEEIEAARGYLGETVGGTGAESTAGTEGGERTAGDPLDTLERLADLHERGVVDDEEFAEKKAELLDRI